MRLLQFLKKPALVSVFMLAGCLLPALVQAGQLQADSGAHRHIVKKGETLWGIANQHLKDPWKWRKLWKLNRNSVKNPHWIYPGQEIDLDKLEKMLDAPHWINPGEEIATEELLPALELAGTPDMARERTASFVVKKGDTLWGIAATRYKNHWKWKTIWHLNRNSIRNPHRIYPGQVFTLNEPLPLEPDNIAPITVKPVAIQQAPTQPATIKPTPAPIQPAPIKSAQPMSAPVQAAPVKITQAVPARPAPSLPAPARGISAHIISIYTGTSQAEEKIIVIIDKGHLDGVENGLVLSLYRGDGDREVPVAASAASKTGYGQVQVFRTFDKTAYATVTQANVAVKLLDIAFKQ